MKTFKPLLTDREQQIVDDVKTYVRQRGGRVTGIGMSGSAQDPGVDVYLTNAVSPPGLEDIAEAFPDIRIRLITQSRALAG